MKFPGSLPHAIECPPLPFAAQPMSVSDISLNWWVGEEELDGDGDGARGSDEGNEEEGEEGGVEVGVEVEEPEMAPSLDALPGDGSEEEDAVQLLAEEDLSVVAGSSSSAAQDPVTHVPVVSNKKKSGKSKVPASNWKEGTRLRALTGQA